MAALAVVWFCCMKLAAAIVRPLLASRSLYILLIVMLLFPLVFVIVGSLISFIGRTYFCGMLYGAIMRQIGLATTWLWALPIATNIAWKYVKTHRGY
jgi:hypothetical protein